jgi:type II secretory pathway component PulK
MTTMKPGKFFSGGGFVRSAGFQHGSFLIPAINEPCWKPAFRRSENGSVLVIVLWVALGLVSIALYFAHAMTFELRAADNRVNGVAADQAIEGAARYVGLALQNFATNGAVPDNTQLRCEAVAIGDSKFWLIGRDPAEKNSTEPFFGLVDEGGKISLNNSSTNILQYLPNISSDFSLAIQDWRGTNGVVAADYTAAGYQSKYAPFESVDELRLVQGASVDLLAGEDLNRNGVLDKSEKDLNSNGDLDPGLLEYVTVWTREPNFHADGTQLTNVNTISQNDFRSLFQNAGTASATSMAQQMYRSIHPNPNNPRVLNNCNGALDFALRCKNAGMSTDDFNKIADNVTTSTNTYFRGRINVNTARSDVLVALFMGLNVDQSTAESAAQTLINYRQQNVGRLNSIAWVIDSLGNNSPVVTALARGNYATTKSFQFTADIAAVGAFGRGYRRVKFIFDMSDGSPKILYRQDLSRLGWALGDRARTDLLAKNTQ